MFAFALVAMFAVLAIAAAAIAGGITLANLFADRSDLREALTAARREAEVAARRSLVVPMPCDI